ncbi:DUF5655 domain-containing protein [Thermoproteota archaeon]
MRAALFIKDTKFSENEFNKEEDLEKIVVEKAKLFFGTQTLYLNIKNKIDTRTIGSSIPDGVLFDFRDKENPVFYLVELELRKHDFYKHIFPQITRFFAFFKNSASRNLLIEKLFEFMTSNQSIEKEFKELSGKSEVYKAIKDILEESQKILIVIDDHKPEIEEVLSTYTDTWDKMVQVAVLKQYQCNNEIVYTLTPEFEDLDLVEPPDEDSIRVKYTESFHTQDVDDEIVSIYNKIKEAILKIDSEIQINPYKQYITLRKDLNFAFIQFGKKKLHLIIKMPFEIGSPLIRQNKIKKLTKGIQSFYNGPSFQITLEDDSNLDEALTVLEKAYEYQNK